MQCSRMTIIGMLLAAVWSAPFAIFANETMDKRRTRLEKMLSVEKDELRRNQQRLLKLDQQLQIRALEQQLASDPQGDQLRNVMLRYHEWLRALPSAERADLLSLAEEQRIPRIKEMLDKQEIERLRVLAKESLSPEDVDQVRVWLADLVMQRKSELLQQLPEHIRNRLYGSNDARRIMFEWFMYTRDKTKSPALITAALKISEESRLRLVEKLSPKAREFYKRASNGDQEKQAILQNWVSATFRPHPPSAQELQELLLRLPPEIRDRLENLPAEQMKSELTKLFFDYRRWTPNGKRSGHSGERPKDRSGDEFRTGAPQKSGTKFSPERQDE